MFVNNFFLKIWFTDLKYRTRGLYSFYVFSIVDVSLKFGGIILMLGGLYSREVCDRERVKLTRVRSTVQSGNCKRFGHQLFVVIPMTS